MMDREQMPTVSWPTLLLIVALPQPVGWLAFGADYDPRNGAVGATVALAIGAVVNTLRWLVRR